MGLGKWGRLALQLCVDLDSKSGTPSQDYVRAAPFTGDRRTMCVVGRVVIFQSLSSRAIFSRRRRRPGAAKGGAGMEGRKEAD